jgi:hypothetical protein
MFKRDEGLVFVTDDVDDLEDAENEKYDDDLDKFNFELALKKTKSE